MKAKDVYLNEVYWVMVSGRLARVRLDSSSPYGGWDATNLDTGHKVRVRTAQRLRGRVI